MKSTLTLLTACAVMAAAVASCAQTPLAAPTPLAAQTSALAAKAHFTTEDTPIGDILDNPAAKAVLEKHLPDVVKGEQIDLARGMTLQAIKQYSPDVITDAKLAVVDKDFAALPASRP